MGDLQEVIMNVEKCTIVDSQDEARLCDASFTELSEAWAYIVAHEQELRAQCLTNAIAIIRKAGYADTEEAARKMACCNADMVGEPRILVDNLTTGESRMVIVFKKPKREKHKLTAAELSEVRRRACMKGLKVRREKSKLRCKLRGMKTTISVLGKDSEVLRQYSIHTNESMIDAFHKVLVMSGLIKEE